MDKAKKQAVAAEINIVSDTPLEDMARRIQALEDKTTAVTVEPFDDDTVRFRLVYLRDGHGTAGVTGEIRRWAGTMAHVICDGDAIQVRRWRWSLWLMVLIAIPVTLPLFVLATGNFVRSLSAVLMYIGLVLGTLCVAALYDLWRRMDWNRVPEKRFAKHQTGIPHYKDREVLLQKIARCVQPADTSRLIDAAGNEDRAIISPQESARREK